MNKNSPFYIIFFVSIVCLIFGLGISIIYNISYDTLKKNEMLHKNKVLCDAFMLNLEDNSKSYQVLVEEKLEISEIDIHESSRKFYKLVESEGNNIGFKFVGMGFWDYISGIIVLTQDLERIVNVRFLDQKETPGLGARILEEQFTDQFKGINPAWNESVSDRIIIQTPSGSKSHKNNEIDSITGATQTSMALNRILNSELEEIRQLFLANRLNNELKL